MLMFLLTLFGYAFPATLFLLGLMGVISGYMPFLTRRPVGGVQIKVASAILTIPLIVAIYLGTRETDSAAELGHLAAMQKQQDDVLGKARDKAELVAQSVTEANKNLEGISEDQIEDLPAKLAPLEKANQEADKVAPLIEAARKPLTDQESGGAIDITQDLRAITERLQMYERFFDRIIVCFVALLFAYFLIPETKPFPREATSEPQA